MRPVRYTLLSVAVLASCNESAPVTAPVETPVPLFDGAFHTPQPSADIWTSGPPTNLALAVGLETIAGFCTGQPFTVSPQRGGLVLTPSGKAQIHDFSQEAFVEVFAFAGAAGGPLRTDPCVVVGSPLVASGTVTFSTHFLNDQAPPGTILLHVTVNGVVDLTSGGKARLHATAQDVIRPNGTFIDKTEIKLTPIR